MFLKISRWIVASVSVTIFLGLMLATVPAQPARADDEIVVSDQAVTSKFRESLTFSITARSNSGKIVKAHVFWHFVHSEIETDNPADDFVPASEVKLKYSKFTGMTVTPPWQVVLYHWEFKDSNGNVLKTPIVAGEIGDDTHPWKKLSNDKVAIYYYNQPDAFVKKLNDTAQRAFSHLVERTGHTPGYELRVVVYNSHTAFCAFLLANTCKDWIGGQTYPGLTVQIYDSATTLQVNYFFDEIIPHELAHAFLRDWLTSSYEDVPSWFDEGQAVNNQFAGIDTNLQRARYLARTGQLQPIKLLGAVGFLDSHDDVGTTNWYAEATSLVSFLYQRWGPDSLGKVIDAVNQGKHFEVALQSVTGLTMDDYETQWQRWLKAPPATQTPVATAKK